MKTQVNEIQFLVVTIQSRSVNCENGELVKDIYRSWNHGLWFFALSRTQKL